jgi:serine/threonine-protein kinase
MDYIDGRRLDAAWADTPHSGIAKSIAALFASVADGVDEAHRLGIVHRDLKPSNILLDRRGVPRVLDFGLAYFNRSSAGASVTSSGQMVGSLPWASPEQVTINDDTKLTTASDVYSLGVMLYQALTGKAPYATTGSLRGGCVA